MNCNVPTDIVFSFTGFALRGGQTDTHHDGWGIAFFEGAGVRHFVDHQAAIHSPIAELIKNYPIKSKNVIAHIRKATQGEVMLENCHPFVRELWGRYWVFAHNGDLKEFAPVLHGPFRPVGTTDSEQAFCLILQELSERFGDTCPPLPMLRAGREDRAQHCRTWHFQHDAFRRPHDVRALLDPFALHRAQVPVRHRQAVRRGRERGLLSGHHAQRSRGTDRHPAINY